MAHKSAYTVTKSQYISRLPAGISLKRLFKKRCRIFLSTAELYVYSGQVILKRVGDIAMTIQREFSWIFNFPSLEFFQARNLPLNILESTFWGKFQDGEEKILSG
jgi:hypothetical protein